MLVAGVLATAAPTSAARADGCNTGCGYGGWAGYTHGGYGGYGCYTGCGYYGYSGYRGYTGYAGHHAPEYGAALPVHGFMPFELAEGESSVALGVTPSTGEEGTEFTWTATVTCGTYDALTDTFADEPVVDGTVTFDVNNHSHYAETVPITAGTATLSLTPPEAGFYTGEATYNGDGTTADGTACAGITSNFSSITVTPAAPPPPPPPPGPGNVNNNTNNNHQHQSQSQSVVVIIGGHVFHIHMHRHGKTTTTAAVAPAAAAPSAPLPVTG